MPYDTSDHYFFRLAAAVNAPSLRMIIRLFYDVFFEYMSFESFEQTMSLTLKEREKEFGWIKECCEVFEFSKQRMFG
jgi:hypothetical protein